MSHNIYFTTLTIPHIYPHVHNPVHNPVVHLAAKFIPPKTGRSLHVTRPGEKSVELKVIFVADVYFIGYMFGRIIL